MLTVKIVSVGVESPGLLQGGVKSEFAVFCESWPAKLQAGGHYSDISIAQGIIHHILILLNLENDE